jgi:hypothetical protein
MLRRMPSARSIRRTPGTLAFSLALALALCCGCAAKREEPLPAPEPPSLIVIEDSTRFVWNRDARASIYRLESYDAAGRLLGGSVTRDTSALANDAVPDTARSGTWRVVPMTPGGIELPAIPGTAFERR